MSRDSSPTIREFRVRAVRVPMTEPHRTASGVVAESPLVLTDVFTDTGINGHSLVFTYTPAALGPTAELIRNVAALVQGLRGMDLYKVPGVAETLDWARSLAALGATRIDAGLVSATMGAALKYQEDLDRVREQVPALVEKARRA